MRKSLLLIFSLVLFTALTKAEGTFVVDHTFSYMAGRITYQNSNKRAVNDSVTYYCMSNAKFAAYTSIYPNPICIFLDHQNDSVVTSKVKDVKSLVITYYPNGYITSGLNIKVSRDSLSWTDISSSMEESDRYIYVPMPRRGDYHIKIKNTLSSHAVYINAMKYTIENCNCFQYIAE